METAAASATDIFVARQPIFDERQRVFAYELLFRSGTDNFFVPGPNPDMPTSHVLSNGMFLGMAKLTDSKPAFLNFTRAALVGDFAFTMAPQDVVIEVLETVEPDDQVIDACRRLKAAGYRLALDDFVNRPDYAPLVEIADFIKVDVLLTPPAERAALARAYRTPTRRMLAEKVETRESVTETMSEGYQFFQGYFFSRPVIMTSKALAGYRLNYLRLMKELNQPEVDMWRLEEVVKQEASIALRLLRRVNSAAYGFRMTTSALRHALVLLGEREIRVCATVWSLAELAKDLPSELIVASTLRARLCEMLARPAGLGDRSSDLFLVGMFSMLDAILQQPMEQIISTLPLADDVRQALSGGKNTLRAVLDSVVAYERGQWDEASAFAGLAGLTGRDISTCYPDAIAWTRGIFESA
jgi:c-di-GMP-related signal transduction protein